MKHRIMPIAVLLISFAAFGHSTTLDPSKVETDQSATVKTSAFKFAPGQKVFVTALDMSFDGARLNLQVQRHVLEQFAKEKKFKIASALKDADFVFFVLIDPTSTEHDEIAFAIPAPAEADERGESVEELRAMAAWEYSEHWYSGKELGTREPAIPTMGASLIFLRPTLPEKALVKKFHKDVLK
jgi:hypothetical protein